jgi:hypothetical protein
MSIAGTIAMVTDTVPPTVQRVPRRTAEDVNRSIRRSTGERIATAARYGPTAIAARRRALDREWDIERTLEANAAAASLLGLTLGAFVHRRWFVFPAVVAGFLLQHAVQGWCPPLPVFRRLGVRTAREIDEERTALKALRGDFAFVPKPTEPPTADQAATALAAAAK